MDKTLLLIGGSNIDYIATSKDKLIKKVSNIGTVSISFGGVMRNIAENLARLGNKIDFLTAIGDDANGKAMKDDLESLGINVIVITYTINSTNTFFNLFIPYSSSFMYFFFVSN